MFILQILHLVKFEIKHILITYILQKNHNQDVTLDYDSTHNSNISFDFHYHSNFKYIPYMSIGIPTQNANIHFSKFAIIYFCPQI